MFESAGWHTETVKYGRRLRTLFARDGGEALRARIDAMGNEEYQRLLRADDAELRERLPGGDGAVARLIADLDARSLLAAFRDLGGHDLQALLEAYRATDAVRDRPSVVFAYTIKGWSLPTEGHPSNHSALLNDEQLADLAAQLGASVDDPWASFDDGSAEDALCSAVVARLEREAVARHDPPPVPASTQRTHSGVGSTQQALGRLFVDLAHEAPEVAEHVVTVSPDVASSTNLGGWINRSGIWSIGERIDWFADDSDTLVRWRESDHGRHIELGIAEVNLVGLLGELGATWSRDGRPLLPVGTIYDPFVTRAHEPWSFGIYAGGQSILVGTPSVVTLGPEGGAHQSVVTPSIGIEQPGCVAWEPAFTQDFEWCFLHALGALGRPGGTSAYFRLSTRPVDQALAALPDDREARRRDVLAGGYRLRSGDGVTIVAVGALVPEALEAADELDAEVVCLSSPDLVFRALQARAGLQDGDHTVLERLFPVARPLVTVLDGHPHTLAFLAGVHGAPIACLGVSQFGQSGDISDLYRHHGIDPETIVGAALDLRG
jgi:pyruvate dehydrogenase E1 component